LAGALGNRKAATVDSEKTASGRGRTGSRYRYAVHLPEEETDGRKTLTQLFKRQLFATEKEIKKARRIDPNSRPPLTTPPTTLLTEESI
jgi:hypothetical protein